LIGPDHSCALEQVENAFRGEAVSRFIPVPIQRPVQVWPIRFGGEQ
jgi:hypothetical protein